MNSLFRMGLGALLSLTLLAVSEARAQQVVSPAGGSTTWYSYVPGRGWVGYNPGSAPAIASRSLASTTTPSAAPGWVGYTPASARLSPPVVLPSGYANRRAASMFVNRSTPRYASSLPAYSESGTGRHVPMIKPWLPLQP
jgi:hypothetical protein